MAMILSEAPHSSYISRYRQAVAKALRIRWLLSVMLKTPFLVLSNIVFTYLRSTIAILATNGVGKTQMLEALMRAYKSPIADSKNNIEMRFNPQVNIGYFDQHMAHLPLHKTITDYIQSLGKTNQEATKLLVNAGFPYKMHTQKVSELSQGEKARLAFLALKVGKFNFFIMDEPTNHIDIDGQEKFEDAVISEGHTCIFVSHDRYMMEQVANKYYQVKKGVLVPVDSVEPFYKEVMAKKDIMTFETKQTKGR